MKSTIRHTVVVGVALWLCPGGTLSGQSAPARTGETTAGSEVSVKTHLDKTAVWVGDQFHYHIFVDHSPRIQFILENLNKDTINLDPLRLVDVASSIIPLKNGNRRLFLDLTLANFTAGVPELQIPQVTLFYFRQEGATTGATREGAAAQGLTIPGPLIAVRSTLPPGGSDLRDAVTVTSWPRTRWVVAGIGWCALVLLIGGVTWETARMIRRRAGPQGPDPRKMMDAIREGWSQSVPADFADAAVVMEFYGRSYRDLKEYLGYLLDTHAEGLTADDIRLELTRLGANPDLIDRAGNVFDICETARYGRSPTELNANVARGVADDMQAIFLVGSRM